MTTRFPIYTEACSSEAPPHPLSLSSLTVGKGKWRQLSSFSLWRQETGAWGHKRSPEQLPPQSPRNNCEDKNKNSGIEDGCPANYTRHTC